MNGTGANQPQNTWLDDAVVSQTEGLFPVVKSSLADQISELQEQYFARAANLIRSIKTSPSLRVSKVYWDELQFTRQAILNLEHIREASEQRGGEELARLSTDLQRLKRERREQAQLIEQLREQVLSLKAGSVPEVALQKVVEFALPVVAEPAPLPVVHTDISDDLIVARIPGLRPINKPRRFLINTSALAVLSLAGYWGLTNLSSPKTNGQVAGVSTDASTTAATPAVDTQYPESFADVSYANTIWDTVEDVDFGMSIEYPKNASNRVRIIGGDNMWFLRKNGFLLKVSRIQSPLALDDWWTANSKDYLVEGQTPLQTTIGGTPAWLVKPTVINETSGDRYFISHGDAIFEVWVKNAEPTTDDGLRIERMLNSFKLITPVK